MGMVLCLRGANADELNLLRSDVAAADDFLFDDDAYHRGEIVDFDNAWNVLQFMFTNCADESDHPLSLIPLDPERIGSDSGYGKPWILSSSRVSAFHLELQKLSDEQLKSRYDPAEMVKHDVHLARSLVNEGQEGFEYVMQSIPDLKALIQRCSDENASIVGIIT